MDFDALLAIARLETKLAGGTLGTVEHYGRSNTHDQGGRDYCALHRVPSPATFATKLEPRISGQKSELECRDNNLFYSYVTQKDLHLNMSQEM